VGEAAPNLHSGAEVAYSSSVSKFDNEIDMGLIISASIRVIKKLLSIFPVTHYYQSLYDLEQYNSEYCWLVK